MAKKNEEAKTEAAEQMIAKRDYSIRTGAWDKLSKRHAVEIHVKKGEDVAALGIDPIYVQVLKTEGVI